MQKWPWLLMTYQFDCSCVIKGVMGAHALVHLLIHLHDKGPNTLCTQV